MAARPAHRLLLAAWLSLSAGTALAASFTLAPLQDASIFDLADQHLADGTGDLWIGVTAGGFDRRTLLRFDLSAIPAGQRIVTARLTLQVTRSLRSGNDPTTLHRLTHNWSEGPSNGGGGGGANAVAGDVTWLHAHYPGTTWPNPGGDYLNAPSATQIVGAVVSPVAVHYEGPGLVADLQHWHAQPTQNHGWILIATPNGDAVTAKRFASRENGVPSLRPALQITTEDLPPDDGDVPLPLWTVGTLAALMWAALRRFR
jgi:hypothetical protein